MSNQEAPSNMDHHHNIEIVNHLSIAVALFDQKENLSEQDIRAKKEILNTILRLTTIPKMNPMKINELLSMILSKLKVQNLLHLRAVCSHWKSAIEAICAQKKCLMLVNFVDAKELGAFSNRFFDKIKIEQFNMLKIKCISDNIYSCRNQLEEEFCIFLGQIFPNVEQLIENLRLDAKSATNLNRMIEKFWPNLNTISMNSRYNDFGPRMRKPKRFDISGKLYLEPSSDFIAKLEHFSCSRSSDELLDKMPLLGPNCASFYWGFEFGSVLEFDRYIKRNSAQVLANITQLGLSCVNDSDGSLIGLICANFPALQVLSVYYSITKVVFDSATCAQFSKLSHLTTLILQYIRFDLNSLEISETRRRLKSIRVLNLAYFDINGIDDPDFSHFDGDRFCRTLSYIFPNIEKLGIFSKEIVQEKIRNNLNHLSKSPKFRSNL